MSSGHDTLVKPFLGSGSRIAEPEKCIQPIPGSEYQGTVPQGHHKRASKDCGAVLGQGRQNKSPVQLYLKPCLVP